MRPEPPPDEFPADPDIPFLAIEITLPAETATLPGPQNGTPITVSGTVYLQYISLEKITVQIGNIVGEGVLTSNHWTYTGKSDAPGKVQIIAVAYGEDELTGLLGTAQHEITVNIPDTVPPHEVTIVAPSNMKEISISEAGSSVSLEVTAQDHLGVGSVSGRGDASAAYTPATPSGQSLWKADVPISLLPLGNRTITARCADKAGNVTERTVTIVAIDTTPPHYEIIEPKDGQKIITSQLPVNVTVKGKAWDLQSGMVGGQAIVEWDLNGKPPFQRDSSGNNWADWEATIPISDYGFHVIHLRFTDRDGSSTIHLLNLEIISAYKPKDTEELLSHRGYLEDLLKFAKDHIEVSSGAPLVTDKLKEVFYQPFGQLAQPLFELGDKPVNQVRVCIEVLRKYFDTIVWIEDALPTGATPAQDGGDGWNWISANPAPYSGTVAHQSNIAVGMHQHSFSGASSGLPIDQDDRLFAYVYLDAANIPEEVMLQWNDGTWEHRACWGADKIQVGVSGTDSRCYMGPLPAAGRWLRLEVPASLVGLGGKTINGMAFTLYGGRATWDRAGKTNRRPLLLAHWKFDEGSGATAFDSSGNGHHGTLQGGATWGEGQFGGKALIFNGIDGYLQVGAVAHLKMSNVLTISAWIHPKGKGSHPQAGGTIVNKEGEYEIARYPDGTIQWAFANLKPGWAWINTGCIAPLNQWTHIVLVYDNGSVKTYANGELVHTYDGEGPIGDINLAQNDFRIGGRQELSHYFQGLIDEVEIYDRPLSAGAIAALAEGAPDDPPAAALAMAEFEYRQAVYQALLIGIGTSYEELRLARGAAPEVREALAKRLGIRKSASSPDELDRLLLHPADLTEANLERLFGLVDTTRDPMVPSPKPDILNWQEAYWEAEWTRQDHPEQPGPEPPPLIIDPDLIAKDDLRNPESGNPALDLWQKRRNDVDNWLATLKSQREIEPTLLAGFDKIVTDTLHCSMPDLLKLVDRSKLGEDIEPGLKSMHLTQQTFSYLMRIRNLAVAGTVTDAEWEDVYSILTQVKKSQAYPVWRTEETTLTLSPAYFRISEVEKKLPAWRSTQQARREWQETLQARNAQQQSITDALQATVDSAEASALTKLRDALVAAVGGQAIADDVVEWLTDTFLIDMKGGGSQTTTRILQAIETLQGVIFALRTSQFEEGHPADSWKLTESEERFDEELQWMGSYTAWRAAMLAFLYRENILLPTLREDQTVCFKEWVDGKDGADGKDGLRKIPRLSPNKARSAADDFLAAIPPKVRDLLPQGFKLTEQDMTDEKLQGLRDKIKELICKSEVVWIEDALPTGATPAQAGGDGWNWISADPAPYSGTRAHQSNIAPGMHQHYFSGATPGLQIDKDDRLFTYVYLDPANIPEEVMLQWNDGSWEHRAYWVQEEVDKIGWGVKGTDSLRYMGPLPAAGRWVRLEVPAGLVGLEGKTINGMAFTLFSGRAVWDRAGKTSKHLQELFYFVPMQLALQLQKSGEHVAALDWYQTVYAYHLPIDKRKVYYGLELERNLMPDFVRTSHWTQQLNPHQLASEWPNAYTRFTLMSIARCFLEFADSEFARDTGESLAKARELYFSARSLLALPEMDPPPIPEGFLPFPPNPVLEALRLKAELQIRKLRNGRNITGMKRQVEIYASRGETTTGLPTLGSDGRPMIPGTAILRPTPYRYSLLIERSKQLANTAQQMEAAYLHTLEQLDAANYRRFQADQGLNLSNARVDLQGFRVKEANDGKDIALKQKDRATIQKDHFQGLINDGLNWWEKEAIGKLWAASDWQLAGSITGNLGTLLSAVGGAIVGGVYGTAPGATAGAIVGGISGAILTGGQIFRDIAAGQGLISQARAMQASFERRRQDWELQASLAEKDVDISDTQMTLAADHVDIANKEKDIAVMESTQAKAMVEFLDKQFLNAAMFDWMSGILAGVYRYFLQQATAVAQLAQSQLTFERQETPQALIQNDYWIAPAENTAQPTQSSTAPDRRGLTGSARLVEDIYRLDQYAFETNKRKLQLTKTISLAQLLPVEFQRFRETGGMIFGTLRELFDRDFPGHYLRLIKRVRTSVIALIPPTQGIRATLTASGISRAVISANDVFTTVVIRRDPELVALSSPVNATGLLELEAQSEMLLPFEAMGVDTTWEFTMPKAANPFDYSTISDILITIDYMALYDEQYRQQVIQSLPSTISAERPFSFRQQFADQWYDLHNPDQTDTPLVVNFSTHREDFPPNLDGLKIQQVLFYFACKGEYPFEIPVKSLLFTEQKGTGTVGGEATTKDGVISTRRGNGGNWTAMIGKSPVGDWQLSLIADDSVKDKEIRDRFKHEEIEDILLVITYSGRTPEWPK